MLKKLKIERMDDTQQIINLLAELGDRIGSLTRDLSSRPEIRKAAIAITGSLFIWTVLRNNQKTFSNVQVNSNECFFKPN